MSDFVVIQKKLLKALAQHAPDMNMLLRVLEEKYDPDPKNKCIFMLMPSNTDKHPSAYAVNDSAEWKLIHIMRNFIGKLCVHLSQEEQLQIIDRLHYDLIFKFTCTVQTLEEALADIVPNARKIIEDKASDGKQATSFAPESVEALIKSLWKQCEEATGKIIKEDESQKNNDS